MELADTFLGVRVDVPLELAGLLLFDDRIRVRRGCRRAGGAHHHARPMDMQTDRSAALFQLVRELDLDAVTLVGAEDEGLNPLSLHARNHGTWIEPFRQKYQVLLSFHSAEDSRQAGQQIYLALDIAAVVEVLLPIELTNIVVGHVVA